MEVKGKVSIEGYRIRKPDGGFVELDLMDEWTFWAWTQGAEERFLWRLQTNSLRKEVGRVLRGQKT